MDSSKVDESLRLLTERIHERETAFKIMTIRDYMILTKVQMARAQFLNLFIQLEVLLQ